MKKIILIGVLLWAHGAFGQQGHSAIYSITSTACTTTAPCTAQIWRVALPGNSTCPAPGNSAYINVQAALVPLPTNQTPTGTHWDYTDTGSTLTNGSTYCGYATVTFNAGGGPGGASAIFQGTIPTTLNPPPPPVVAVTLK